MGAASQSLFSMFTARQKIKKEKGEPTELENQVAQAFVDLEINNEELRPYLKNLHIAGAKEVVVNKSTAAIVIFLPYRLKDLFRKNQVRLVRELEKKFSGQHVVLVATRNIQDKESRKSRKASKGQVRPRSRTLTAVHEAILSDLVSLPTSVASAPAWPLMATRPSRCLWTTPMSSLTSSRLSLLCTAPSRASTPASSSPSRRSKLVIRQNVAN